MCFPGQSDPDIEKTKALEKWPAPNNISDVRSFMGLASFYRKFIKIFGSITALIIDCLRKGTFQWSSEVQNSFEHLIFLKKQNLC